MSKQSLQHLSIEGHMWIRSVWLQGNVAGIGSKYVECQEPVTDGECKLFAFPKTIHSGANVILRGRLGVESPDIVTHVICCVLVWKYSVEQSEIVQSL